MVERFEETKGPYKGKGGHRGGGDRGGRGGDRGGRGGRGGGNFESGPRQSLVSNTPPGAISLITNHFKMRVKQKGNISLYTIDFGATIDRKDMHRMREAVKNCSKHLEKTIGKFIYHSGHIFAMQGQVG